MRVFRRLIFLGIVSLGLVGSVRAAFAAELKLKVVDPNAAPVPGAQASIYAADESIPLRTAISAGDGTAEFSGIVDGKYRVQVLAPGFATYSRDVTLPQSSTLTAALSIVSPTEIVVVSATRTLVPVDETGASVSTLENIDLIKIQTVNLGVALRFFQDVVVN